MKSPRTSLLLFAQLALAFATSGAHAASTEQERRIEALEQRVAALEAALESALRLQTGESQPAAAAKGRDTGLDVGGDFRLRYEHTAAPAGGHRNRGVVRGRLAASYALDNGVSIGARLTTGNPDDPNTADVTLGQFVDDLEVSLDRAYIAWQRDGLTLMGGKMPSPANLTDLVWDGDVNLNGLQASYDLHASDHIDVRIDGVYALIDEQVDLDDSYMAGARATLSWTPAASWRSSLAVGYYDYSIGSLASADGGDIRDNLLAPGGNDYLSDFDLLNLQGAVTVDGPRDGWPVTLAADFVRNLGAAVPEDSGYALGLGIGRASAPGDLQFGYRHMTAETDAVFTAFSHDNIPLASNYRMHALNARYVPFEKGFLDLILYRYARRDAPLASEDGDGTRLRINVGMGF